MVAIVPRPPKSTLVKSVAPAGDLVRPYGLYTGEPRHSTLRRSTEGNGIQPAGLAQLIDRLIVVKGRPYGLPRRKYVAPILNLGDIDSPGRRNVIVMSGRQIEKTTMTAAKLIMMLHLIPYFRALYIAPRWSQVREFSNQRFDPIFRESTEIYKQQFSTKSVWQVAERQFRNGSVATFRSCFMSADGARGISANFLFKDELQDLLKENIDILDETLAHSEPEWIYLADLAEPVLFPMKYRMGTGTPKTGDNPLSVAYYRHSCQFEWFVRCEACNHYMIMDAECVSPTAYLCTNKKCRKPINPQNGLWEAQKPENMDKSWGFRIPQMMVPFMTPQDIFEKSQKMGVRQFHNEVLGLPYDYGALTLTEASMRAACTETPPVKIATPFTKDDTTNVSDVATGRLFAGVDWGEGKGDDPSYTVIAIGTPQGDSFRIVYLLRLTGRLADLGCQDEVVDAVCRVANVEALGADWGHGAFVNRSLMTNYGWSPSVRADAPTILEFQNATQYAKARWKRDASRYIIDRSTCVEEMIDAIKRQKMVFPNWAFMRSEEDLADYVVDFTNLVSEYDERTRRTMYHSVGRDDAFFACMLAYLTWQQMSGRLVRQYTPNMGEGTGRRGRNPLPELGPMDQYLRRQFGEMDMSDDALF